MTRETTDVIHLTFDELEANLATVIDRVSNEQEAVVIEKEGREVAILVPPDPTRLTRGRTEVLSTNETATVQPALPVYSDVESIVGAAGSLKEPLSWDEMREIAAEDHAAEITNTYR